LLVQGNYASKPARQDHWIRNSVQQGSLFSISRIYLTWTGIYLHLRGRQASLAIDLGSLRQLSRREGQEQPPELKFLPIGFHFSTIYVSRLRNSRPTEDNDVAEQTSTEMNDLITMTADVVAAYVAQNALPSAELPALIQQIHATLQQVASGAQQPAEQPLTPAVPIKKSVTRDYIICLEDGKRFKSLKRHLRSSFDLSPEEYRKKWGLAYDYPMVAPNYAQTRSDLAKSMGLGNLRQKAKQAAASAPRATRKSPAKKVKAVAKKPARKSK
jgi:predicted transcriptional regulator